MDNANGNENNASVTSLDVTPAPGKTPAGAGPGTARRQERASLAPGAVHRPGIVRQHVHGSVLEGGDSPAVLAQPAAVMSQGQGSAFHPDRRAAEAARAAKAARRARRAIAEARDNVSAR